MKSKGNEGNISDANEQDIVDALGSMQKDPAFLTKSFYRGTSERWTDNHISFVDYHIHYLKLHPALDPEQYISNLRLKLRKTPR